jgi:hypothetical protein
MNRQVGFHASILMSPPDRQVLRCAGATQQKSLRWFLIDAAMRAAAPRLESVAFGTCRAQLSDGSR